MPFDFIKQFFPDRLVRTRIWRGPFRGARIVVNPRNSMRKILGLYEHELNPWLEQTLHRVTRVLDVGANDGYFTFGCAAAFRRLGKKGGEIIAFEPQARHIEELRESMAANARTENRLEIIQTLVGRELCDGMTTLDAVSVADRKQTLVKIDVEGAEMDVVEGGQSWIDPSNLFLIEVHAEGFLDRLRNIFAERGHPLVQVNQRPLRLLGRELREVQNWWLVSDLGRAQ